MMKKKSYNESRVLQTIWQTDAISRSSIAEKLNLNKSTITKILTPIIEDGLIIQGEKLASGHQGGRKAEVLSINENYSVIAGIEINTSCTVICITDMKGKVILTDKLPNQKQCDEFMKLIENALDRSISICRRRKIHLLGAALGVSGVINPFEGIIYSSNPLKVKTPVKIYDKMDHYPFPILIENDANCCCYRHLVTGSSEKKRNFITVLGEFRKAEHNSENDGGIAIGLGLVLKGEILHGEDFSAGEFQSLQKNVNNPSQFNITKDESENLHYNENILKKVLRELSRNLSLLVNTLNISNIIFEGDINETEFMLRPILRDEIQRNWNYDSQVNCQMIFSNKGESAVAHGAACYFLNKLFSPPAFWENRNDYYPSGINLFNTLKENKKEKNYA